MSGVPVAAIPPMGLPALDPLAALPPPMQVAQAQGATPFSRLLSDGVQGVNSQLLTADRMAHDFALDDSMPVHQVTYALEQARLSLNLMMQVRNRLVEAYQQMMNMQL